MCVHHPDAIKRVFSAVCVVVRRDVCVPFPEKDAHNAEGWTRKTSGPDAHCVFKLRRLHADQLSLSGKGGAQIRALSPFPSPQLTHPPPALSLSLPLSLDCRRPTDTCSHFTQDEPNHVVSGARWSPGQSQQPPRVPAARTRAVRQPRPKW